MPRRQAITEVPQRPQVALTCVLDRSGSMGGEPLHLVCNTVHFLIDQLGERDCLGLLSYAGDVREDLPLMYMTAATKQLAHAVVDELKARGGTALYDGLMAGVQQQMVAEADMRVSGGKSGDGLRMVRSCFLFTDGQATNGKGRLGFCAWGPAYWIAPGAFA